MKAVLACHSSQAAAATYVYFWVCFWGVHVCVHGGDLPSAPAWAYKISVWISVIKIKQTVGNWQQQVSPKTSVDNIIQKTFIMMNVLIWAFPNTGGYVNLNESIIPSIIFIYLTCTSAIFLPVIGHDSTFYPIPLHTNVLCRHNRDFLIAPSWLQCEEAHWVCAHFLVCENYGFSFNIPNKCQKVWRVSSHRGVQLFHFFHVYPHFCFYWSYFLVL